jgi:hypothetical protein
MRLNHDVTQLQRRALFESSQSIELDDLREELLDVASKDRRTGTKFMQSK